MRPPRTFRPPSTLAEQMRRPGGRTVAAALSAADAAVDERREAAMASLQAGLGGLQALAARRALVDAPELYARAAALLDLAGFFDTGPLYDAAYSLCDLCERMQGAGAWRWPPVEAHLQALARILADDCRRDAGSEALLESLRALNAHAARRPVG